MHNNFSPPSLLEENHQQTIKQVSRPAGLHVEASPHLALVSRCHNIQTFVFVTYIICHLYVHYVRTLETRADTCTLLTIAGCFAVFLKGPELRSDNESAESCDIHTRDPERNFIYGWQPDEPLS